MEMSTITMEWPITITDVGWTLLDLYKSRILSTDLAENEAWFLRVPPNKAEYSSSKSMVKKSKWNFFRESSAFL